MSQHGIHGIKEVASHHRYLVYDYHIERGYYLSFFLAEAEHGLDAGTGKIGRQRKLEKRMYCNPTGIYGSHAGRSKNNSLLAALAYHSLQKRGLTCTSLACEENAASSVLYEIPCLPELCVFCSHFFPIIICLLFPSVIDNRFVYTSLYEVNIQVFQLAKVKLL